MKSETLDICLAADDARQGAELATWLGSCGYQVELTTSAEDCLQTVFRRQPRIVVADLRSEGFDGLELFRRVRAESSLDGTFLVFLSAVDTRELRRRVLQAGADEFVRHPIDRVEFLARLRNGARVGRLEDRLHRAALTDGLTGLWNHTQFRDALDREFSRTRRYGGVASLLMIDLDHFKAVNDTYGHEAGNRVLCFTARSLKQAVREVDVVARYGGEEFAVICPQTSLDEATGLAERIRSAMAQRSMLPEHPELLITASFGIASTSDPRVQSVVDLINLGDQALYLSKRSGRNRITRADHIDQRPAATALDRDDDRDRLERQVAVLSLQAKEVYLQSVWSLVQALEARDHYTAWHSRNVTFFASQMLDATRWPPGLRAATANAAMLHDLGKIGVPDCILQKVDPLTDQERHVLRRVPLTTCAILEPLRMFQTEILIIRHLREHYDGSGYPDQLRGEDIPIASRLLAVTETFESLTSDRAYRRRRSCEEALERIRAAAGTHFDPQFVDLLARTYHEQKPVWDAQIMSARDRSASLAGLEPVSAK